MGFLAVAVVFVETSGELSKRERIFYVILACAMFIGEMRAISKDHKDNEGRLDSISDSITGGKSIPSVEVLNFRGDEFRLSVGVHGNNGLIITQVYLSPMWIGSINTPIDFRPGFLRPKQDPVITSNGFAKEKDWGYFSLPSDGYKVNCTIHAYNGSYRETIEFSKSKRGNWSAKWHTVDTEDKKRFLDGFYPNL
jgi:hypothetical protein